MSSQIVGCICCQNNYEKIRNYPALRHFDNRRNDTEEN